MEQLEQGMSGMTEIFDRYGKEIRAISEEALGRAHEASVEEFRGKISELQDRMHWEACEMYDRLGARKAEIEHDLAAKLNSMRETMKRAELLKEIICSTVKPGVGQ